MVLNDPPPSAPREPAASERLESWKEIAAYLKRDESTVRRWEAEGLPVHRLAHKKKATVYAYKSEIDGWWNSGLARLEAGGRAPAADPQRRLLSTAAGLTLLVAVGLGFAVRVAGDRVLGTPRADDIASIAVLPLKNLSGDATQDYFADGMTDALTTELGKMGAMQVLSYQSVVAYRHTSKSLPEIARELTVESLLEGSVLRSGDRLRVTANLIRMAPERHVWADTFDFDRRDVLEAQRNVAREVAAQIRVTLTKHEQKRPPVARRVDPDVYEAYLLGRAYMFKAGASTAKWQRAQAYFETAIERDRAYAPAYASLSELWMSGGRSSADPNILRVQARQWADKALELDATLAEPHAVLGRLSQQAWDWTAAEREYGRALELNPSYAIARIWYAMFLDAMERFPEAMAEAKRAERLEPASPFILTWAGATYLYGGRTEDGLAILRRALELDPSQTDASLVLARTYLTHGTPREAIIELERALAINEKDWLLLGALAHAYARAGQREQARTVIAKLKRMEAEHGFANSFAMAWAYAGLMDRDEAFRWLQRAYDEHRDRITWLKVDPLLDPLRSDPRFDELVRRMGLPHTNTLPASVQSLDPADHVSRAR